ncbi:MAG: hypothetical protein JWM20_930 [Patescibacteria group bacterium]|nr:hypothetical protein [Patescibacteria group bacterium]
MTSPNLFFLAFIATVLLTRVALYFKPIPSPTIKGFRLHHYMYGLVIAPIGILVSSPIILGIGLGLFLDEVPYLLIGGKNHKDNYSTRSLLGVLALIVIVYVTRNFLTRILLY